MPRNQYLVSCIKYFVSIAFVFTTIFQIPNTKYQILATSPLETAQSDYNFEYSKFRDAQEKYTSSKNAHKSFKTATSKDQAYIDSKAYLNQAINLHLAYLALVNEYVNSVQWQNDPLHTQVQTELDNLDKVFLAHQQQINTTQTLEDLTAQAKLLNDVIQKKIDPAIYWITTNLVFAREQQLQLEFESIATKLGANPENFPNPTRFSNWQSEINAVNLKSQTKLAEAKAQIDQLKPDTTTAGSLKSAKDILEGVSANLSASKSLLFEAAKYQNAN